MNRIAETIEKKTSEALKFMPDRGFYEKVQIKQKRFGQLMRNEKEATYSELQRVANYFNVPVSDLITEEN